MSANIFWFFCNSVKINGLQAFSTLEIVIFLRFDTNKRANLSTADSAKQSNQNIFPVKILYYRHARKSASGYLR